MPTWLLSMWISNTATSLMMVSILNCVITKLSEQETFNLSVMQDSNQNGSSGDKPSSSVEGVYQIILNSANIVPFHTLVLAACVESQTHC